MLAHPLHRRTVLQWGALGTCGLGLADILRLRAIAGTGTRAKSVIMINLPGGPSHIDMYDMKPDAPAEFRGEFSTISTNLPGFDLCEHMPLQASVADKFSLIRSMRWLGRHDPYELLSGYPSAQTGQIRTAEKWPVFGSVVSKLRHDPAAAMPPYVNLNDLRVVPDTDDPEVPRYLGAEHAPFRPSGPGLANLKLADTLTPDRLAHRRDLLARFDQSRRAAEANRLPDTLDQFEQQAFGMITSGGVYRALDLAQEDPKVRQRFDGCPDLLTARRLVEAGVSVVTVSLGFLSPTPGRAIYGVWDTHADNFSHMKKLLPDYDRAIHALLTDLYERGLDQDVLVVVWGEFGRTPRIGDEANALGSKYAQGRGHWWDAGFTLLAGGGLKMGQIIGETDSRAERVKTKAYTPQNILATIYHTLGIDPSLTFPDFQGRPMHLLDDREPVRELM